MARRHHCVNGLVCRPWETDRDLMSSSALETSYAGKPQTCHSLKRFGAADAAWQSDQTRALLQYFAIWEYP